MTDSEAPLTWKDRVRTLHAVLGRKPTLDELLAEARLHEMTPAEVEAQRQSWVRAFTTSCEHGKLDFEQCPRCRGTA